MTARPSRALRADAQRNRARMLDAARTVFQRDGLSAQMDAIAAEAGLGVGTLYRHFPTREALIDVLIAERLEQLVASAVSATENADAWAAVEDLLWRFAAFEAEDRGMADILSDYRSRAMDSPDAPVAAFMDYLSAAIARAQSSGEMRSDVSAMDVLTAVCGLGKMVGPASATDPDQWRRLMGVLVDGLRRRTQEPARTK
ncbi:MAG: TetR/AcrR family transcriptional regulator [Chloroflexi bacterium]|nr:TetR/AcrR family transcriptional regulator [Chloroflexota bacterium]